MRKKIVPIVLTLLLAVLLGDVFLRERHAHVAPAAASAAAAVSAPPSASGSASASSTPPTTPSGRAAAGPGQKLERPLSVVGLGWDLITPGVVGNDGLNPKSQGAFGAAGVPVRLRAVDNPGAVEAALARGGVDEAGADVALLPLPTFVASYERLRALNLEMFYVVGWTRGREVLESVELDSLTKIETGKDLAVHGVLGSNATFLALFALDLSGVEPAEVTFVKEAEGANLVAVSRDAPTTTADARVNVLLTSGDAARLIPIVAVAQRGLVREQRGALVAFTRTWRQSIDRVEADAAAAARKVATQPNAPEPVDLLARLGLLAPASLAANTELLRLSGRGAVSLDVLFFETYDLWRAARLLTTPPPVAAPMTGEVIAALVLAAPELVEPEPSEARAGNASPDPSTAKVLIAHPIPGKLADEDELVAEVGYLAGVFPRSGVRLTVFDSAPVKVAGRTRVKSAREIATTVVERATERYGLEARRVTLGAARRTPGNVALLEVLAVE